MPSGYVILFKNYFGNKQNFILFFGKFFVQFWSVYFYQIFLKEFSGQICITKIGHLAATC